MLLLVERFELEKGHDLASLLPLILGGFLVHSWLPRAARPPFFLALSWAGFGVVFGPALGALLIGIGLALIGICHLPAPQPARMALLTLSVGLLVALRAEWLPAGPTLRILPVLGSIFMFRLAIYAYDIRHEQGPVSLWTRLSYFFLLPNAVFPLFPIVDYKGFQRTYYDRDEIEIYRKGARWMLRGVMHLLLYRLVYQHMTLGPEAVHDLPTVLLYAASSYLLYLRISGQFHLIIGILCLFGFNLPETHRLYFLASGFNDLWRRINIYWKNFMMKLFFYPIFLKVQRRSPGAALTVATLAVFLCSWLLHSFQWFWIRGSFPFTAVDAIFWGLFAVCVLANSYLERRFGSAAAARGRELTARDALVRSLKTVAMFCFMCSLWSFWIGTSVGQWFELVGRAGASPAQHFVLLGLGLAAAVALGTVAQLVAARRPWERLALPVAAGPRAGAAFAGAGPLAGIAALLFLSTPEVHGFEPEVVRSIRTDHLNAADYARLELGYYEELLEQRSPLDRLWELPPQPHDFRRITDSEGVRIIEGIPNYTLVPSSTFLHNGVPVTTNRFGMRDREYGLPKPPGTFRMAVLGGSIEMGVGVQNGEVFEQLVEDELNRRAQRGRPWRAGYGRYEILNLAVVGYTLPENTGVAEQRLAQLDLDACLLFFHGLDEFKLRKTVREGFEAHPDSEGLPPKVPDWIDTPAEELLAMDLPRRTRLVAEELLRWGVHRIAAACARSGIEPYAVYLHHPVGEPDSQQERPLALFEKHARAAGFTFLALTGDLTFGRAREERELALAPWDRHPNPRGHRMIADELLRQLLESPLPSPASASVR